MKRVLLICLVVIMVFTIIGCSNTPMENKENNVEDTEVKVNIGALKGPTSMGMIKMIEEKPSLGVNVVSNYDILATPDILLPKLFSKEVDFANIPVNAAAKVYNKGIGYKVASVNTLGVLYLIGEDEGIKSWNDLKGKKINAMGKGATPETIFKFLLEKNQLDPEKDVTIDYSIPHTELAQMMAAGEIKLAVLPEPFVTMVTMKNKNVKVLMNFEEEWQKVMGEDSSIIQSCLVVRDEFAKQHPETVDNFLKEYEQSVNWVNKNTEEAGVLIEKNGILAKAKIAQMAIPRCNIVYKDAKEIRKSLDSFLKVLYDFSPADVGGKLPDEGFYYIKE